MTWSGTYPDAAGEIEELLIPNFKTLCLDTELIEEAERICSREDDPLETCANKYEQTPHNDGEYGVQARSVINKAKDKSQFEVPEVQELFSNRKEPDLSHFEREYLKTVMGLVILKNGDDDSEGRFSVL